MAVIPVKHARPSSFWFDLLILYSSSADSVETKKDKEFQNAYQSSGQGMTSIEESRPIIKQGDFKTHRISCRSQWPKKTQRPSNSFFWFGSK